MKIPVMIVDNETLAVLNNCELKKDVELKVRPYLEYSTKYKRVFYVDSEEMKNAKSK